MFGKKKPASRGQGANAAKQMGLFVEMDPEEMLKGMNENLDDPDLEAELAALTGGKPAARGRAKPKGKTPLPMEDIARMADECLKDIDDDDDDENVEDDEDLLAELQEVVGEDDEDGDVSSSSVTESSVSEATPAATPHSPPEQQQQAPSVSSAPPGSIQHTVEERIVMYQTALTNAKASGEASKVRRLERGLKSLQSMLTAVKKGRSVNESELPPPVATGALAPRTAPPPPPTDPTTDSSPIEDTPISPDGVVLESSPSEEEVYSTPLVELTSPEENATTNNEAQDNNAEVNESTRTMLMERQKEYKMAALRAKKQGDTTQAMQLFKTSKGFDAVIEALTKGEKVDLSNLPPSLGQGASGPAPVKDPGKNTEATKPLTSAAPAPSVSSVPSAPKDALEALEQRKDKYLEASAQAKANGDDRKARMHERIAKQYQNAIRAHKAGKPVNFDELPVPPGFPPIPGQKSGSEQGIVAALEAANKLASTDITAAEEDEEEEAVSKPELKKPALDIPPVASQKRTPSPDRKSQKDGLSPNAAEQIEFLENRKKQYLKAALEAKKKNDTEQAKALLRKAKGLEPIIEATKNGKPVDISQVPSPPGDEEDDFIMVHHSDVQISEKSEEVYSQLFKILKEQHDKCLTYSKQFTHLGNVKETTKFEKMAESCKKSLEFLKLSQAKGLPPPKHHFEEKAFNTVSIFPELSSTEMVITIVKGMNLPAPSGIQPNDLYAFVKFDFPYPSTEQPQRHKTHVIKNNNSPEYNQSFTLTINRNHRGFRRVVANKGFKLELFHKGGFLRSDKPIGTAVVKLENLETQSEIREIVEVMDGRKGTGGRVEVRVRLREPLSAQDVQTSSERWLVIDKTQALV